VEHCPADGLEDGSQERRKITPMATSSRRQERLGGDGQEGIQDADALQALMHGARSARPLAKSDEAMLLTRAGLGDRSSQDRLVAAHMDRVIRLAAARGEQALSLADLVQEGSIGLLHAVRTFADSGETNFTTFAEAGIGAQMDAALAAEAAAVREGELLVAAATDYERAELVLARILHRAPTAAELAEKLEWTVDRTLYVANVVADARRRYDEEMLAFIDPEAIDLEDDDDERSELDG
jgi:DNA-directed RNA polymerase sigma subunit (sigma70/sigma32)